MRALFIAIALFIAAACAGPTATPSPQATSVPLAIELADFEIRPEQASTSAGPLVISVTSAGPTPHNLTIRDATDAVVAASDELSTGESGVLEADLVAGDYTMFCALPGHESLGMSATLTVTD